MIWRLLPCMLVLGRLQILDPGAYVGPDSLDR